MNNNIKINPNTRKPIVTTRPKRNSKRISESIKPIEPIFEGEDVFVVGGGSSLKNFNFELLRGRSVIAINRSFIHVPFAQVLYYSDYRFYLWCKGTVGTDEELIAAYKKYKGRQFSIANKINDDNVHIVKNTGKNGFDIRNGCIKHGGNSGYAAINLAYHLGAKRVILMGYDMKAVGGNTHYHKGYLSKQSPKIYERFLSPFDALKRSISEIDGFLVYNTSMDSDLKTFEKRRLELFL